MRSFFAVFLKSLLYLTLSVVLLFVTVAVSLQIPAVQTVVVNRLADYVSEKLDHPIHFKHVYIRWFDSLVMEGVSVLDLKRRPMITVNRLEVDYNLQNLIDSSAHNIHIDEVLLYQPDVRLIKNPKTGDLNIDEFIANIENLLAADPNQPAKPDNNVPFTIGKASVIDGKFTYDDPREKLMNDPKSFDYNHFTLEKLNGNVRNFLALGDTIALDVTKLRTVDRDSKLTVHRMDTKFLYCAKKMEMANLTARIGNSLVRDHIVFLYDHPRDFGEYNDRILMQGNLENCRVSSADLGFFSDYIRELRETWLLSGWFNGTVKDFRISRTDLRFGPAFRSRLRGELGFKGLPETDGLKVDFWFHPSQVNMADIRQYYPEEGFNHTIQKLGTVDFDARFTGLFDNFHTSGNFRTAMGNVFGKLDLKLADERVKKPVQQTTYSADLKAENLALGELIDRPDLFQTINGHGRISGRGFSVDKANVDVDGAFEQVGVQGYNYRNLVVRGNLQKAFFNGHVGLRDPNLQFYLDGECDLGGSAANNKINRYDLRGAVQHADLRALGLMPDSLVVKTELDVQMQGNTLDEFEGQAFFRNGLLSLNRRNLPIDTLSVVSVIRPSGRHLLVNSDFLIAQVKGNFLPNQTVDDLARLWHEYELYFMGDVATRQTYYARKQQLLAKAPVSPYQIDYWFLAKQVRPLVTFLDPSVQVASGTRIEGQLSVDNTMLFTANVHTDSVRVGAVYLGESEAELTTSKFTTGQEVLASVEFSSKKQQFNAMAPTEKLVIDATWDVDHIDFRGNIQQQNSTNRADLHGEMRFKGDAIDMTFQRAQFHLLESDWSLNPQSLIRKVGDEITFRNVSALNGNQLISAVGKISRDSSQMVQVRANNFSLETLDPVLNTSIRGTLNGMATIRNLYETAIVESSGKIMDLSYDDFRIGDVTSDVTWDPAAERLNIDARVNRDGADLMTLTGKYAPDQKTDAFNLKATLNKADLRIFEPFAKDIASNFGGVANGAIDITGTPKNPILKGTVDVQGGRLTLDYLKADLTFDDKIYFGPDEIIARRILVRDPQGNTAVVRGGVYHDSFRYFQLRFDADLKNFRIMNTTAKDNDMFYGVAYATGKAELFGPIDNLTIRANVTSNKGTKIYIPFDGATSVASQDVIRFVNRAQNRQGITQPAAATATTPNPSTASTVDLSGILMDFTFNITPDAYCEIQLDRQTGDIIKAYGNGVIAMQIDTKGDFSMTGAYAIDRGEYTFTFENVINKRFQIRPNSRITWTGDPYKAMLDVTAVYTQYTSLAPVLNSITSPSTSGDTRSAENTRRYPVDLLIKLNGDLLQPGITYDIDVKEYPASAESRQAVTAFETKLQSNEQELTRQVSSLLLFNQLMPEGSGFFDSQNNTAGLFNSVSELLSNQISRLASNLNENLDIGVSFGGFTSNAQNESLINNLQLRFSYRFLNDRFRISRDGGFTYGQNQYGQVQTNTASLLGEWTLEYWITPDGRMRAKMYNRNQQSMMPQGTGASTITTGGGISFLYTRTFNHLFGKARKPAPGVPTVNTDTVTDGATTTDADELPPRPASRASSLVNLKEK
nr:translocation/assembly module TamB domain-containing protein [uncultured Arsenicibacter sp.]